MEQRETRDTQLLQQGEEKGRVGEREAPGDLAPRRARKMEGRGRLVRACVRGCVCVCVHACVCVCVHVRKQVCQSARIKGEKTREEEGRRRGRQGKQPKYAKLHKRELSVGAFDWLDINRT